VDEPLIFGDSGLHETLKRRLRMTEARPGGESSPELAQAGRPASLGRIAIWVLLSGLCYYLSTRIAWALCFPDSKVSLFFPPRAVLVSILLLVPTRHWWIYTLASICSHFVATQQADWPPLYALHCEVFDSAQSVAVAAGIRIFIKSPFNLITLREAVIFVLISVVIVPFGAAFWGAAFTVSNHFGTRYWVEWRNLGVSNAVTVIVLVPAILIGVHHLRARRTHILPARGLEAAILGATVFMAGVFAFNNSFAGSNASPVLLYTPIALLIWAALRFGLGGVSAAMVAATFQAVWGTMHGRGPFLMQTPTENALALQMFLLVMAIPLMLLAVIVQEQTRSKDALRESEERTLLASEAAQLGMWMWDIQQRKMWVSEKLRELLQFSATEPLTYQGFLQRVHHADRTRVNEAIQRALAERGRYQCEYRVTRREGGWRWMSDTGRVRSDSADAPVLLLGVSMDVTERRRSEEESRFVSSKLITAQEDERKRIARDLHDDLNQRLALLSVQMDVFSTGLQRPDGEAREVLDSMISQVKDLSTEVHRLSYQLHPAKLDQLGLVIAARTFCREVSAQSRIPIQFEQQNIPRDLSADVALCLYRVTQEALQNSIRHSGGAAIQVSLTAAAGQIQLIIADKGKGFDVDSVIHNGGLGLVSMRERVRQVNGSILFSSSPGQGARIEVTVPLREVAPRAGI
jgi:PAS domain S-box-containing protein